MLTAPPPIYDKEHPQYVCPSCFANHNDDKDDDELCRKCQLAADQPEEEYYR